jgi:RNA recognition motif-containing protein
MKIFVGNISKDVTDDDLYNLFVQFGAVKEVKIVKNQLKNESKGYAFVEMSALSEARNAIESLNNKELKGKRLNVNEGRLQGYDRARVKTGFSGNGYISNKRT